MNLLRESEESSFDSALKALKNSFRKSFLAHRTELAADQLTAFLLLVSLYCLHAQRDSTSFGKLLAANGKDLDSLSDSSLFALSSELYEMVCALCNPAIKKVMAAPQLKSIQVSKNLLQIEHLRTLGNHISAIGFSYQILGLTSRQDALRVTQTANKEIDLDQLIAFTQLYTPTWVVDFLIANTVLPLAEHSTVNGHTPSDIVLERFRQWYLPTTTVETSLSLKDLKLIDPACGSGQFLLSAFDLFVNLHLRAGASIEEAIQLTVCNNLFGADIDARGIWVATLGILTKCLILGKPPKATLTNLCWAVDSIDQNLLGSISRNWLQKPNHLLASTYEVVVTNPPYIGRKSLSRELKSSLRREYPQCRADLCAAFLERSLEMLQPGGRMGMIAQSSLLTLPSYKSLRAHLETNYNITSIVNCGTGVFPLASGEKIDNMLLVAEAPNDTRRPKKNEANAPLTLRLNQAGRKSEQLKLTIANIGSHEDHFNLRSSKHSIELSKENLLLRMVSHSPPLSDLADIRQGLATTNNRRFVRYVWDVPAEDIGPVWVPYIKGAGSERWYSENNFVVKWGKDGSEIKKAVTDAYPYLKGKSGWVVKNEQFYFRSGLCFSFINKKRLAVRRLPPGCIFDVASSAIFTAKEEESFLLAYLNSTLMSTLANTINPTINLQVGDLKRLPLLSFHPDIKTKLSQLAELCYERKLDLSSYVSKSLAASSSAPFHWDGNSLESAYVRTKKGLEKLQLEIRDAEKEIDEVVAIALRNEPHFDAVALEHAQESNAPLGELFDPRFFATTVLTDSVQRLIKQNHHEDIFLLPLANTDAALHTLGLKNESVAVLEKMLDTQLMKYFRKPRVVDFCKQLKKPSRYFGCWLPNADTVLFISGAAFRHWCKTGKAEQFGPESAEADQLLHLTRNKLATKIDWTSSELKDALNDSLAQSKSLASIELP